MFDPTVESPIPLLQVPRLAWLPHRRKGRPLNPSTVFAWAKRGLRGAKLEVLHIGGTMCTSEQALLRFFNAISRNASADKTAGPAQRKGNGND